MARATQRKREERIGTGKFTKDELLAMLPRGTDTTLLVIDPLVPMLERLAERHRRRQEDVRIRRQSLPAKDGEPTAERLKRSGGGFEIGDDKQGGKTWTMMDSPLERMAAQGRLSKTEYDGLVKYRIHWFHAGLQPTLGSVDPNRIFASDPSNFSGMAKSEAQVFHRQKWREACDLLGHRAGIVVDNVVCTEQAVVTAGYALGWKNRPQAEAAAIESLRDSGWRLAKHWGMC